MRRDLGDPAHFARIRSHRETIQHYASDTAMLSLIPLGTDGDGAAAT